VSGVQRVPVDDQRACVFQEAACRVREVTSDLRHPCPVGTVRDAGDVNVASFQIDDEEHEVANKPADRPHLNAEEVGRCDRAPVSPQERAPRKRLASARGRLDPVVPQDALDRRASPVETEVVQRSPLETIVTAFDAGATAEEIAQEYASVDRASVYAVISYVLDHRREVDEYVVGRRGAAAELKREIEARFPPAGVRARLLARRSSSGTA